MKHLLLSLLILVFIKQNSAQTPTAIKNSGTTINLENAGLSANNPWLGSQIGYKFGGVESFSDNLLVSAAILQEIPLTDSVTRFHLPIMGNISQIKDNLTDANISAEKLEARVQQILLSKAGFNIGFYPYYELTKKKYFAATIHGVASYKLNSFDVTNSSLVYLHQGRFSVGIETSIGQFSPSLGRYPVTLSLAPTLTTFMKDDYKKIFGEEKSTMKSFEITGVIPAKKGFGVLMEGIIAKQSVFRVGVIISKELN